ncbi:hypothetical protein C1645_754526 [Glomus cerebriforme]|uniref:Uncharacterized protein n=1 Tax=Glomus cerebriforme TaxID=658196 RepID=A0A397TE78_9GLOM|nr:hypothetical protein C1645_754526 [Glomus cerebriforme]
MIDQHNRYYETSLRNFKLSLGLILRINDVLFIKLLLHKEEIEETIHTIQTFCNENPSILTGHRLLFEVLYTYERLEYEWVEVGKKYHRIDPVSPPDKVFNPLMEHYTQVIEQTDKDDRNTLADAYFNLCELLFQRIEYGDDNSDYLYKAIECIVWLKYFDDLNKDKINELLRNRGEWFNRFLFYTQKKTVNSWREFQCYRILNECLGDECCYLVEKIKEHILSGKDFRTVLYNFEKKNYYGNTDGKLNWKVNWKNIYWSTSNDLRSNDDDVNDDDVVDDDVVDDVDVNE